MRKNGWVWFMSLIVLAAPWQGNAVEDVQVGTPGFQSQIAVEPSANPNQVVVSVLDPAGNPILGLQPQDFILGQGIRKARILSAEPMASTQALPVNLVLVIDNSFSMHERQAIPPPVRLPGHDHPCGVSAGPARGRKGRVCDLTRPALVDELRQNAISVRAGRPSPRYSPRARRSAGPL